MRADKIDYSSDEIKKIIMGKDPGEQKSAFNFCVKQYESGDLKNCGLLYKMYRSGIGTEKNDEKSIEILKAASEQKKAWALREYSAYLYDNSVNQQRKAIDNLTELAKNGDTVSLAYLGNIYYEGSMIVKDLDKSLSYYQEAYSSGLHWASRKIVEIIINEKIESKYDEAYKIATKMAKIGDAHMIAKLGEMYYKGVGVNQSRDEAIKWLKIASDANVCWASLLLANILLEDKTNDSNNKALLIMKKCAESGNSEAMYQYGKMCLSGIDPDISRNEAIIWFGKAAEKGNRDAKKALLELQHVVK